MDLTTRGSFRLFRVAGITVFLHWTWFLVAYVQIANRSEIFHQPAWSVVEYVSIFAIVLMHEFGHALACRSVGGRAREIVLWPLGGIAYVAPPARPGAVLWSIAAGPLVNVALVIPTFALALYGAGHGWEESAHDVFVFVRDIAWINLLLLVFNLLPVYPLDGGQILQSLLWFGLGRWRSLQVASLTGIVLGGASFLFILIAGVVSGGAMETVILGALALFIIFRSLVGFQQSRAVLFLLNLPRHEDCVCPNCGMNPPRGTFWVCSEHCQTRFDLFDTRGRCPGCGAWFLKPECPHCGRLNHIDRWFTPVAEQAEVETGPATLPTPKADASGSSPI
jgi:Zn-dependent protease